MSEAPLTATGDGVAIAIWVIPGSSRSVIDGLHGDMLEIRVTSPPEGGKANAEVARLLSDVLDAESGFGRECGDAPRCLRSPRPILTMCARNQAYGNWAFDGRRW